MNILRANSLSKFFFAGTLFLGAFLLFLLEPLFAKRILPWFGGAASVWTTCLVFFQGALLLGYLYADQLTRRLSPKQQAFCHIALLALSLLFLPIAPQDFWRTAMGLDPALRVLGLLSVSIGLPFVALSATSPLLQAWYARRYPREEPYFLFAVSNLASLLALLSFPLLVEPRLDSLGQAKLWSALFILFAVFCTFLAWTGRKGEAVAAQAAVEPQAAGESHVRLLWFCLPAGGSMLLLSVTHQICANVAPVPLLWVLPLALYLLTFTLAFHQPSLYPRRFGGWLLATGLAGLGVLLHYGHLIEHLQAVVPAYLAALFLCCFFCHGELAALRPAAGNLTTYYLMVSLGGAMGAVIVGLVAPALFRGFYEFPLSLILAALLALGVFWPKGWLLRSFWVLASLSLVVVAFRDIQAFERGALAMKRNFYAALQVAQEGEGEGACRVLYNGIIDHGAQFLDPAHAMEPTTYYAPESGVGMAMEALPRGPRRVGVIGLGSGTLAAYGRKGDFFRFYDINPQVVGIAHDWFTFLKGCRAKLDIVEGDARLSLESEPPQHYDLLVVDAFSGDAIPVHLLTWEAVALYLSHLKPGGILAIHTTNIYLRLEEVVKLLADEAHYPVRYIQCGEDDDRLVEPNNWVLVTRNRNFLGNKAVLEGNAPIEVAPGLKPWTDADNNLFEILRPL